MDFAGSTGQVVQIAVISDTHGLLRREVVAALRDCTHILHAGDIVREGDLDELRLYGAIYAVRGNNDLWQAGLQDLAGVLRFKIAGVSFLMTSLSLLLKPVQVQQGQKAFDSSQKR